MLCPFCENTLAAEAKFCPHCGSSVTAPHPAGAGGPYNPPPYGSPPYGPPAPPTSSLAITSLVAGLVAWFVLPVIGALVAVITGHMARGEIRAQRGQLAGDGMALTGMILGYIQLVLAVLALLVILAMVGFVTTQVNQARPKVMIGPPPTVTAPAPPRQALRRAPGDDVDARVIRIISEQFAVPAGRVTPATSLADDLNADDLDRVELVMELEEEFDVVISDEDAETFQTVGQVIELIKSARTPSPDDKPAQGVPPKAEPPEEDPQSLRRDRLLPSPRAWAAAGPGPRCAPLATGAPG